MTLTYDSNFDLAAYIKLVHSLVDGQISEQEFVDAGLALDADPQTLETVISHLKHIDQVDHA